jgi:hypothetical protein
LDDKNGMQKFYFIYLFIFLCAIIMVAYRSQSFDEDIMKVWNAEEKKMDTVRAQTVNIHAVALTRMIKMFAWSWTLMLTDVCSV